MGNNLNTGNQCGHDENQFLDTKQVQYTKQPQYDKQLGLHLFDEKILKETNSKPEDFEMQRKSLWFSGSSSLTIVKNTGDEVISVFDVAAYILKTIGTVAAMKLQKLVYYCQAWSLVWDERPLFKEEIEAWANGPVVKELFAYHRGMFQLSSITIGNPDLLNDDQKDTTKGVIEYYGDKPSQWLTDLTHMEEPWKKARTGLPISVRSSRKITLEDMAEYYSSLPLGS